MKKIFSAFRQYAEDGISCKKTSIGTNYWKKEDLLDFILQVEKLFLEARLPKAKRNLIPDDEWLKQISILYPHVRLENEINKMKAWILTPRGKGRQITRGLIVNWINKIDIPMQKNCETKDAEMKTMTAWQIKEAIEGCQNTIKNIKNLDCNWHTIKNQYGIDDRQILHSARVKIKVLRDKIADLEEMKSRL